MILLYSTDLPRLYLRARATLAGFLYGNEKSNMKNNDKHVAIFEDRGKHLYQAFGMHSGGGELIIYRAPLLSLTLRAAYGQRNDIPENRNVVPGSH